jgi:hypothetical protein
MMLAMRTTITLDPDVEALIRKEMRRNPRPFKTVVNDALRKGLMPQPAAERKPFVQRTSSMGPATINLDKALQIAAELEDEEIIKKLRQGR